ncbi:MAG: hypothetical protein KDB26_15465 [Microthrixaceae bacterium]|nr:hypothetical protein [Microthrixaceae bacterium]
MPVTKTKKGSAAPNKKRLHPPTPAEALERLMTAAAIDLIDLAVLTGVSTSTVQRHAAEDKLPVPTARIGQRWIVPSAPVRKLLQIGEAA